MNYRTTIKLLFFVLLVVVLSSFSYAQTLQYNLCIEGEDCVWGTSTTSSCRASNPCYVDEGAEYIIYANTEPGPDHTWITSNTTVARLKQPLRIDGADLVDGTWLRSRWKFAMVDVDTTVRIVFQRDNIPPRSPGMYDADGYFVVRDIFSPKHGCYVIEGSTCSDVIADNAVLFFNSNNSEGYDAQVEYEIISDIWQRGDLFRISAELRILDDFSSANISMDNNVATFDIPELNVIGPSLTAGDVIVDEIINNESAEVYFNTGLRVEDNISHSSGIVVIANNTNMSMGLEVFGLSTLEAVALIGRTIGFMDILVGLDIQGDVSLLDRGDDYGFGGIILEGVRRSFWPSADKIGIDNLINNPGFENPYGYWGASGGVLSSQVVTSESRFGDSALLVSVDTPGSLDYNTIYLLKENNNFSFSAWVRVNSVTDNYVRLDMNCVDLFSGTNISYNTISYSGDVFEVTDWTITSRTFNVDNSGLPFYCIPEISSEGNGSINYYIDALQLEDGIQVNKFKPRALNSEGDAELGSVTVRDELNSYGAAISFALDVQGFAADSVLESDGNIKAGTFLGPLDVGFACDAAVQKARESPGRGLSFEFGSGLCAIGNNCTSNLDCASNDCTNNVCV